MGGLLFCGILAGSGCSSDCRGVLPNLAIRAHVPLCARGLFALVQAWSWLMAAYHTAQKIWSAVRSTRHYRTPTKEGCRAPACIRHSSRSSSCYISSSPRGLSELFATYPESLMGICKVAKPCGMSGMVENKEQLPTWPCKLRQHALQGQDPNMCWHVQIGIGPVLIVAIS